MVDATEATTDEPNTNRRADKSAVPQKGRAGRVRTTYDGPELNRPVAVDPDNPTVTAPDRTEEPDAPEARHPNVDPELRKELRVMGGRVESVERLKPDRHYYRVTCAPFRNSIDGYRTSSIYPDGDAVEVYLRREQ